MCCATIDINTLAIVCLSLATMLCDNLVSQTAHLHQLSKDDMFFVVQCFLIATTAKDCSVMFTLERLSNRPSPSACSASHTQFLTLTDTSNGHDVFFAFRVSLIDLDPRSPARIPTYATQDQQVVHDLVRNCCSCTIDHPTCDQLVTS
jgi:hypothetical protein